MRLYALSLLLLPAAVLARCGAPQAPIPVSTQAPVTGGSSQPQCSPATADAVYVADWPDEEKGPFEAAVRDSRGSQRLLLVYYDGCRYRPETQCWSAGHYDFHETSGGNQVETQKTVAEVAAQFRFWGPELEAKMSKSTELRVEKRINGEYRASAPLVRRTDLQGSCERVTHVVAAMEVGALAVTAGAEQKSAASVSVPSVGGFGGGTGANSAGGSAFAKQSCTRGDKQECRTPVRLLLGRVVKPEDTTCPAGKHYDYGKGACVEEAVDFDKRTYSFRIQSLQGGRCNTLYAGCDYVLEVRLAGADALVEKYEAPSGSKDFEFQWKLARAFSESEMQGGVNVRILNRGTISNTALGTCSVSPSSAELRHLEPSQTIELKMTCADQRTLSYVVRRER